jgi:hypothetical protein
LAVGTSRIPFEPGSIVSGRQWRAGLQLVTQLYRPNHVEAWLST